VKVAALLGRALHVDRATRVSDNGVHQRQTETGALADLLGGEEGFEKCAQGCSRPCRIRYPRRSAGRTGPARVFRATALAREFLRLLVSRARFPPGAHRLDSRCCTNSCHLVNLGSIAIKTRGALLRALPERLARGSEPRISSSVSATIRLSQRHTRAALGSAVSKDLLDDVRATGRRVSTFCA